MEALPNIGVVQVDRSGPHIPGGTYSWDVTFQSNPGSFPDSAGTYSLQVNENSLVGTAVGEIGMVFVSSVQAGSKSLDGTFQLRYRDLTSSTETAKAAPQANQ